MAAWNRDTPRKIQLPLNQKTVLVRENVGKRALYRQKINICCWPGCGNVGHFETHHIVPVSKGGSDEYTNFICLCHHCHSHHRLHSLSEEHLLELRVYKFYQEKLILGYCSDDLSEADFHEVLLGRSPRTVLTKGEYESDGGDNGQA